MEALTDNMQKYENYKEQFKRLNKAIDNCFYLEAMFIAYAIMEDRTESILRRAGQWDAYIKSRKGYDPTIDSKIRYIKKRAEQKKTLLNKYFSDELISEIHSWKNERNPMTHALLNLKLHTEDLADIALRGEALVKIVSSKVSLYNRAIERQKKKQEAPTHV